MLSEEPQPYPAAEEHEAHLRLRLLRSSPSELSPSPSPSPPSPTCSAASLSRGGIRGLRLPDAGAQVAAASSLWGAAPCRHHSPVNHALRLAGLLHCMPVAPDERGEDIGDVVHGVGHTCTCP